MSIKPYRFPPRDAFFSRRSMTRELVGIAEFVVIGGALFWLSTSPQGENLWVWMAVGFPILLAYIFIGGYVRHRLGLTETSAD